MEAYFSTMSEDNRREWSLILLLSITDPDILKQCKFTDHETNKIKNLALEKLDRRRILKAHFDVSLTEKYFLFDKWLVQIWKIKTQIC